MGSRPYAWQREAALSEVPPTAIDIPTGAGKTEGILFAWLWRRLLAGDARLALRTPRRLAIALPMRTLVEQTEERIAGVFRKLAERGLLSSEEQPKVRLLLGGEAENDWSLEPHKNQVLVGTVDMLLSRALNRGFGRGCAMWPVDFGLLNADTWWVFDEVQLLDAAVATSCQLAGLRRDVRFGIDDLPQHTTWMSATLDTSWLGTIDHDFPSDGEVLRLCDADTDPDAGVVDPETAERLRKRLHASKSLRRVKVDPTDPAGIAEIVLDAHARRREDGNSYGDGWITLALCNTVKRARILYEELQSMALEPDVVLLHSRFRPPDRHRALKRALDRDTLPPAGRIVVTTQVIEAGVDLDAAGMVTELAPWASLVQRAGRLNRGGERPESELFWLDPPDAEISERLAAPYDPAELQVAREKLLTVDEGTPFGPAAIADLVRQEGRSQLLPRPPEGPLLRGPDLVELFDTDPSLDGEDTDIRQYIRLGRDLSVQVAWRDLGSADDDSLRKQQAPKRDELCPVSLADRHELAKRRSFRWSYVQCRWEQVRGDGRDLRPGDVLLVDSRDSGYSVRTGWDPCEREEKVPPPIDEKGRTLTPAEDGPQPESDRTDTGAQGEDWITIAAHTDHVVEAIEAALGVEGADDGRFPGGLADLLSEDELLALRQGARFHDAGKAHQRFQERVREGEGDPAPHDGLFAKSPTGGWTARPGGTSGSRSNKGNSANRRPAGVFRHEVASVAIFLAHLTGRPDSEQELAAYLIGAHHGKLRLTPRITTEPRGSEGEDDPAEPTISCLGVRQGDPVPAPVDGVAPALGLGGGVIVAPVDALDIQPFTLGGRPEDRWSWSEAALRLRDRFGPLRLAYLEALLRAADMNASATEFRKARGT